MSQTTEEAGRVDSSQSMGEKYILYGVIIFMALWAGYYLAQYLVPTPKIGVIYLQSQVSGLSTELLTKEIEYARHAPDIKGVVMVINSPGGSASDGHETYFQVRKLRDEKPVIASMDVLAASAAYQIGVAANEIYAKPASIIGNIGVIMGQPSPEVLSERFVTTGPFKSTGGSATSWLQMLNLLHADFRDSVIAERSQAPNPLKLSPDEVATGEIWVGVEAKEFGLIDELGSRLDAIERAAALANLSHYQVVDVRAEYLASLKEGNLSSALTRYEQLENQPEFDLASEKVKWPEFYQLYIPLE
jgi:protease-4